MKIKEKDRNKSLMLLIDSLVGAKMYNEIILLGEMIQNDTLSMKTTFNILLKYSVNDVRILEMCERFEEENRELISKN